MNPRSLLAASLTTLALAAGVSAWALAEGEPLRAGSKARVVHATAAIKSAPRFLAANVATAKDVLRRVLPVLDTSRACECPSLLKDAVITSPAAFPLPTRRRLDLLLGKYFPLEARAGVRSAVTARPGARARKVPRRG